MPHNYISTKPGGSSSASGGDREKSAHTRPISVQAVQEKWNVRFPFTLAAPSFVLPAGAAENSLFLADYFPEIALLFFETEACLAYTETDLPAHLADLACSWNVHLPLDLRWEDGLDATWQKIDGLLNKAAYLSPHAYVLHPPTQPDMLVPLAARLRDKGVDPAMFLVENIGQCSLTPIWEQVVEGGYSACLDIGHILAYGQHDVLDLPGIWERTRMLHVYGAERRMKHWPLTELDAQGQEILCTMLEKVSDVTVTLELFDQTELFDSLDLLGQWISRWGNNK
ncbi:hypothetical protein DWB63_16125 [Pseudodesulfovibrio sp. S3]|nr:cobamide remodeling phosphodiesterase CbiR [Pseudodesulfovibrio sp. S3-i]MCJ2166081.1 hypothetical protein [Pseudodesulfovibrio sp. S3-i]RWU02434.1 hypothetical protein DWB63_16125 [Pseudodesulfovibrio sp. S3]